MKKKKKSFLKRSIKPISRRFPKRCEGMLSFDRGSFDEIVNFTSPEETEVQTNLIPHEKTNPNTFYIMLPFLTITYYLDSGKCFIYTVRGKYLGTLEKHDLKKLFFKIGMILRYEKKLKRSYNIL